MSKASNGAELRAECAALQARGLGWPPKPYSPGGWWRDEPLAVCERQARNSAGSGARWAAFVTRARDEAAQQWQAGDKRGALRTLCGAGVFKLAMVPGHSGPRAVRAVAWHRSGAVRRVQRYSEKHSMKAGEVRMGWHEPTVRLMLTQGVV